MALSGSQLTSIGGINPWHARGAITAKAEFISETKHILFLSKESNDRYLNNETTVVFLSKEKLQVRVNKND